jgi:pimeloyl-ACP methyl ester carboxylesterase
MSIILCDGVQLGVDEAGQGTPLLCIHGAWTDRTSWDAVSAGLATHFRVVRYDRRGYGESQRPGGPAALHVADALALLRTLGGEPAILVGNSLGAVIAIEVALAAPDLVHTVIAHEPPFLRLLLDDPRLVELARRRQAGIARAVNAIRDGDPALGARIFVESVTSAPGAWEALPDPLRDQFLRNAPAFLAEGQSLDNCDPDLLGMDGLGPRLVLTRGEYSGPYFKAIIEKLVQALPRARSCILAHTGHVPQQSHPREFVAATLASIRPPRDRSCEPGPEGAPNARPRCASSP